MKNVKEYVKKVNINIMKISKYIEMHVEKYLFKIIHEYIKNGNYKNM